MEADLDNDLRDREADADTKVLIRCCGEERPFRKGDRLITIVLSEGSHFVTVKDYICGELNIKINNEITVYSNKSFF